MASKGYIDIWYNATIQEIHEAEIRVKKDEQDLILQNSFVFIFAGAEMPHKFLMSLGVQIDKKFAEGLSG